MVVVWVERGVGVGAVMVRVETVEVGHVVWWWGESSWWRRWGGRGGGDGGVIGERGGTCGGVVMVRVDAVEVEVEEV